MKTKIIRILNVAFYPAMIVLSFRCYAFGDYEWLLWNMAMMTCIAAAEEYGAYRKKFQLEVCKGVVLKLAEHIDELNHKEDAKIMKDIGATFPKDLK